MYAIDVQKYSSSGPRNTRVLGDGVQFNRRNTFGDSFGVGSPEVASLNIIKECILSRDRRSVRQSFLLPAFCRARSFIFMFEEEAPTYKYIYFTLYA